MPEATHGGAESPLAEADLRRILRLLGRTAVTAGGLDSKRRALLAGLSTLVDADAWMWALLAPPAGEPDDAPALLAMLYDGLSDVQFAAFVRAQHHPHDGEPFRRMLREARQASTTRDPIRLATGSPAQPIGAAADALGETLKRQLAARHDLVSACPGPAGVASVVVLRRGHDRSPFTAREVWITHLLHAELDWLHKPGITASAIQAPRNLSNREKEVWAMLIDGRNRGDIAQQLGLSVHTVNSHVKRIFRAVGVRSQMQLMRQYRFGGDTAAGDPRPWQAEAGGDGETPAAGPDGHDAGAPHDDGTRSASPRPPDPSTEPDLLD